MKVLLPTDRDTICQVVTAHFGIEVADLQRQTIRHSISKPRQIVFYLIHRLTGATFTNIAPSFGVSLHGVRYGILAIAEEISVDRKMGATVTFLEDRCKLLLEAK